MARRRLSFFLRSDWGDLAFLGRLLKEEGHTVALSTFHPEARDVGRGLIDRARSKQPPSGAIVIFDGPGHGHEGEQLRAAGHPVIGGNPLDTKLELNRGQALAVMKKAGIAVPDGERFKTYGDALSYLRKQDDDAEFFFKAEGNKATALTQSGSAELLIRFLEWARRTPTGREIDAFLIQAKVTGTEVSTEGWFDGKRWVYPFNSTLEEKKLMVDDLGPRTGCQSNLVWVYDDDEPPLVKATVLKLTDVLHEARYQGPIDVNAIVDDHGTPLALELSPRTGFDALQAFVSLLPEGTVGEQLEAFARGQLEEWDVDPLQQALTLRVSIPPYPVESPREAERVRGLPLDPLLRERPERILLDDVMLDDKLPVCAGRDGNLCVLVTTGDDLALMRTELLHVADSLEIPDKQYRTDVLPSAEERIAGLKAVKLYPGASSAASKSLRDDEDDDGDAARQGTATDVEPLGSDDAPFEA